MFPSEASHVSGRRFVAHLADGVIFTFVLFIGAVPIALASDVALIAYLVLASTAGHVAYFVATQRNDGQTPGKRIAGIKVVDATGAVPTVAALVRRSIPLLVEYFYVVALIAMQSSPYRQRLGDRWGGTYVISAEPRTTAPGFRPDDADLADLGSANPCGACGAPLPPGVNVCPSCGRVNLRGS